MTIFNDKTVVGLFDNGKDVETAMAQLQAQGFGPDSDDDIQIINAQRLAQEMPVDALAQQMIAQPDHGSVAPNLEKVYQAGSQAGVATDSTEDNAYEVLTGLGVGDEEASFFARHVARGNPLVVVDTSPDRAAAALQILQQANARIFEDE